MVKKMKKPLQIYLREDQMQTLRRVAERQGESIAELVRQGVDLFLDQLPPDEDPLMDIVGLYDSRLGDLADNHDEYLARLIREEHSHES